MDSSNSTYRPQSPDLSSYTPQSPDLSGLGSTGHHSNFPTSPPAFLGGFANPQPYNQDQFGSHFSAPTAYQNPPTSGYPSQPHASLLPQYHMAPGQQVKMDYEGDYHPDGPSTRTRRGQNAHMMHQQQQPPPPQPQIPLHLQHQQPQMMPMQPFNGYAMHQPPLMSAPMIGVQTQLSDPTHGVQLKTSFPVARIKRIMQADEDIGKVAQVTPHVVSRALELFMIKLITASVSQVNGGVAGKGQKRILAQHLKRVIMTDDNFDFLREIANKIADAPAKSKKEPTSDSDESKPARKKGKKRKDSTDDF